MCYYTAGGIKFMTSYYEEKDVACKNKALEQHLIRGALFVCARCEHGASNNGSNPVIRE